MNRQRFARVIWAIIVVSLGMHVFFLVAGRTFLKDWRGVHEPIHTAMEISGALTALLVATVLVVLQGRGKGTSFNPCIAGALIGMGLLDGLHSLVHVGELFVWLHSTATFVGALLFVLVWLPRSWVVRMSGWWHWAVLTGVGTFGFGSIWFGDRIPPMVRNGQFTRLAEVLNVVGGIVLLVAALRLVSVYFKLKNVDDLLFCLHCSLFGAAGIMFEQSELWDAPWWGWHLLRLMAYGVAFWFVVRTERQSQHSLVESEQRLQVLLQRRQDETRRVRKELDETRQTLVSQTRLATIGQVAASIAHELRNPLGAARNAAFYLSRHTEGLDSMFPEYLGIIDQEINSADRVIRDMMEMARSTEPVKQRIDLGPTFREVFDHICSAGDTRCNLALPEDELLVQADPGQLRQVIVNLLTNAVQAMDRGGKIQVEFRRSEEQDIITVRDNGPGIAAENRERVFEPLFSTKAKGAGLGLTICRQILRRHGGDIELMVDQRPGTSFCIRLPQDTVTIDSEAWARG